MGKELKINKLKLIKQLKYLWNSDSDILPWNLKIDKILSILN